MLFHEGMDAAPPVPAPAADRLVGAIRHARLLLSMSSMASNQNEMRYFTHSIC